MGSYKMKWKAATAIFLVFIPITFGCKRWVYERPDPNEGSKYDAKSTASMKVYEKFHPLVVGLTSLLIPAPFNAISRGMLDSLKASFSTGSMSSAPSIEEITRAIRPVIRDELTKQTIEEKSADLEGTINWYDMTYLNLVDNYNLNTTNGRRELWRTTMIEHKAYETAKLAELFSSERYKESGLGFFQAAASLHLAIIQQQSLTDASHMNPEESAFKKVWEEYSIMYANRGRKIVKDLINNKISHFEIISPMYRMKGEGSKYAGGNTANKPNHYYIYDGMSWYSKQEILCPQTVLRKQSFPQTWCYKSLMDEICRPRAREVFDEFVNGYKQHWDVYNTWDGKNMDLKWTSTPYTDVKTSFGGYISDGTDCGKAKWTDQGSN